MVPEECVLIDATSLRGLHPSSHDLVPIFWEVLHICSTLVGRDTCMRVPIVGLLACMAGGVMALCAGADRGLCIGL